MAETYGKHVVFLLQKYLFSFCPFKQQYILFTLWIVCGKSTPFSFTDYVMI